MSNTDSKAKAEKLARNKEMKAILLGLKQVLLSEVRGKVREVSTESSTVLVGVVDDAERMELDTQGYIEWALIKMKAETLDKVNQALVRLDFGTYGACTDCDGEISLQRLRALPFAIRCKECERADELQRAS